MVLGASVLCTPIKKRRIAGDAEAANALVKAGDSAASGDAAFMASVFESNPALAGYIRSMWEKGTLKVALARYLGSMSGVCRLGEKLPEKALTVGSLPRPFVWTLTWKAIEQCNGPDSVNAKGWVMSDEHAHRTITYALQSHKKQPLVYDAIVHPEYEGSLMLVLLEHMRVKGNVLRGMTPDNAAKWGYFYMDGNGIHPW